MSRFTCRRLVWVVIVAMVTVQSHVRADEPSDEREQQRKERLEYLTEKAGAFEMSVVGRPDDVLTLEDRPVLRYTNPVRNFFTDGVLFLWRRGEEPAVLGALSVRGNGKVFCELASLTSSQLNCDLGTRRTWSPEKTSQFDIPVQAKMPLANDARRQALAMRQLIRRFTVWMHEVEDPNAKKELRLLNTPLFQWTDPASGAHTSCFGFAETNDPEALVLLKYTPGVKSPDSPWTYTLSRMTSRPLVFELDASRIHESPAYWQSPQSPNDSYVERNMGEYPPE